MPCFQRSVEYEAARVTIDILGAIAGGMHDKPMISNLFIVLGCFEWLCQFGIFIGRLEIARR